MSKRIRFIPEGGSLVEITSRTVQGRFLLRPSPHLNELIVGVLARALKSHPVRLHGAAFLSNHYHLILYAQDAKQLAGFMEYVNGNIPRAIRRVYGWEGSVWSSRYHSALISEEEAAQIGRLKYVLAHGAKEGLVASPFDWPGVHCAQALATGGSLRGHWVDRNGEYEARRSKKDFEPGFFRTCCDLSFEPLPCWSHLDPKSYQKRVLELIHDIEREATQAQNQHGRKPLGVQNILRQNPEARPKRLAKSPAPFAHAASSAARELLKTAYGIFFAAYRAAAKSLRAGDRSARFPPGCFPPALPFVPPGLPARGG